MLFKIQHHKHAISIFDETDTLCASFNKTPGGEHILSCFKIGAVREGEYNEFDKDGNLMHNSRWTPEQVQEYAEWLKQKA